MSPPQHSLWGFCSLQQRWEILGEDRAWVGIQLLLQG